MSENLARRVVLALVATFLVAGSVGFAVGGAVAVGSSERVRLVVRGWPCEEDEVIVGHGDYDGIRWDRYACANLGW